jgi:hypothetical protein
MGLMWCPHCGQATSPGAQFCSACGRSIAAAAAPPPGGGLLSEIFLPLQSAGIMRSPVFLFLCLFALAPLAIQILRGGLILDALSVWWGLLWALLIFRFFADRDLPFSWAVGTLLCSVIHGTYDTFASIPLAGVLVKAAGFYVVVTYVVKCRGLSSAQGLAGGIFKRTVMAGEQPQEAAPPPPRTWQLRGVSGPVAGRRYPLVHGLVIGRDPSQSGLHLEEPTVSRQHAMLESAGGGWRIRRLSQTGDLFVNGRRAQEETLRPGDQVQIGSAVLLVELV